VSGITWGELERRFAAADRKRVAAVAWRAAERVAPVVASAADVYGPEALEWLNAITAVLRTVERWVNGEPVSRFTLDLAADMARATATAAAGVVRLMGPSKAAEDAELAFAAAAFAADVCRTSHPHRAASAAMQGVRAADATGLAPRALLDTDAAKLDGDPFGLLWPLGEPDWWADGKKRLAAAGPLVRVLG
jgi:hypothetical protein